MIDKLLAEANQLDDLAHQIQNTDEVSLEEKPNRIEKLSEQYREWFTSCLSILPNDLQRRFDAEYVGVLPHKPKIREFLENPLEPHPLYVPGKESAGFPKWLYPYSKVFHPAIQEQKTILSLAKKRPGILIPETLGKVFNDPSYAPKYKNDLFVIMPFSKEMRGVYTDHIARVASRMHLSVVRADDFFTTDSILQDVWNAIHGAQLIIADCTGRNPNVFYELGIAHTIRKPTILITQKEEDVPFDLRHLRYIPYEYTPPGMRKFEKDLQTAIEKLRQT